MLHMFSRLLSQVIMSSGFSVEIKTLAEHVCEDLTLLYGVDFVDVIGYTSTCWKLCCDSLRRVSGFDSQHLRHGPTNFYNWLPPSGAEGLRTAVVAVLAKSRHNLT